MDMNNAQPADHDGSVARDWKRAASSSRLSCSERLDRDRENAGDEILYDRIRLAEVGAHEESHGQPCPLPARFGESGDNLLDNDAQTVRQGFDFGHPFPPADNLFHRRAAARTAQPTRRSEALFHAAEPTGSESG